MQEQNKISVLFNEDLLSPHYVLVDFLGIGGKAAKE